jgi:glutathione S-transferase
MYTLHIGNKHYSSWSLRPWVLMRELQIPFDERLTPFDHESNNAAFRRFSPTGKVPCLVDDGTTVWDSLAIAEYLAERHPDVWPADAGQRAWARCAAAEMHSGFNSLRDTCPMACGLRVRLRDAQAALQVDLDRLEALWSQGLALSGGPYLAGSRFGAVDAFFAPVAFRIQSYDLQLSPQHLGYARRLLELPSMREWYIAALAETTHDPAHDKEILQKGQLLRDLRDSPPAL